MLLIRVVFAFLALSLLPAAARADVRSPVLGETSLLSSLAPVSTTYPPSIASDGNTTYVAYMEEQGGIMFHRISATGTEIGAAQQLQSPGTASTEYPRIAVSGNNVYVAWIQGSFFTPQLHAVVATSRDGGRTFSQAVMAGHVTGGGAWDLELGADGENVFVAFVDNQDRLWTAGSRDGGKSFPCMTVISSPGDESDGGGDYSLTVDGDHVYWTWLTDGFDIVTRRSTDGGRTIEPAVKRFDSPGRWVYPGVPTVKADNGNVVIAYSTQYVLPREDKTGTDWGFEPQVLVSHDSGASFSDLHIGNEGNRCIGNYCAAPYGLDVDGDDVYLTWRGNGSMWLASSHNGGGSWSGANQIGPYLYGYHSSHAPYVAARGDMVIATWYTAPNPTEMVDTDAVAAVSSDRGRTFDLRTIGGGAGQQLSPVVAPWGPDPLGAGFAYWMLDENWYRGDTHVKFVPMSAAQPDVAVLDVRPEQVASDAARLAAGRPTTIRTMVRSMAPVRTTVRMKIELAYDEKGARMEKTIEEDVVIRPGLNPVHLLARDPVLPGQGRITAKVTAIPDVTDIDPSNNSGEGSRAVVQPRPLKLLFVPVSADDELPPACRDVRDVADGTAEFLKAAWPIDPAQLEVVTDCSSTLVHPSGLTEAGLMDNGMLMSRLDRLKWSAAGIDKVIGVVPQGWFSRQQIDGFAEAVGIAPQGGGLDAAIVERQNTGGWVVAHELAHNLGWTEVPGAHSYHLDDEPAPGFWVAERRDVPASTLDFMQFNTAGGSVTSPTGRWMSKKTWDYLTTALSTGVIQGLAASNTLSFTGSVSASGAVKSGAAWELPGDADADGTGPYTFEQLDAGGTVLQTRTFDAVNTLGPIGNDTAKGDKPIVTDDAGFSLRVPALAAARSLRIRRGGDVLLTRVKSAAAPVVKVDTPARMELGADLKVTWTASDADGDALTSMVSVSLDGGATWRSLGDAVTGNSLTVKAILQLAGTDVRVRVTTTDGWNTTSADSGAFTVGGTLTDGTVVVNNWFGGIWTVGLDGTGATELTKQGLRPKWSPDGSRLVYDNMKDLFTMRGDGSEPNRVSTLPSSDQYLWPAWTPDGDQILAERRRDFSHEANVLVDAKTGAETPFAGKNGQMCGWTRDGSRLLGQGTMYQYSFALYRADGTEPVNFPQPITGYDCMSLSPDGRFGVVARVNSDADSRINIVIWDLQAKTMRSLTNNQFGGYNAYPTWSPTGDWIVFGSNRDRGGSTGFGSTDLWKIRPDGTGAQKIMDGKPGGQSFERPDVQPRRGTAPDTEPTLEERLPVAAVKGAAGVEGTPITLDAGASKPGADDVALASYAWDLDGDGIYADATGAAPIVRFGDEGTYPVSVLVTDARGRVATASADVKVTNAAPAIADARVDDAAPASFSARVTDAGVLDTQTAKVFWNGSADGVTVPLVATDDGYVVMAHAPGHATSAKLVVSDGDGGTAEALASRIVLPANGAPTADDATAKVLAGADVSLDLPARDPEAEALTYEIVEQPAHGTVSLRAPALDPAAADVTYNADEYIGTDTFTYRVKDSVGESRTATVTVDVQPRPDEPAPITEPGAPPIAAPVADAPRVSRSGAKPIDPKVVEAATTEPVVASAGVTLPSTKTCVSRRKFSIRIKKGAYTQVVVWVNGKQVKALKGTRITASVDLRGLPKGRFKVKIAATLKTGKVVTSTRQYRTCTKKGARS